MALLLGIKNGGKTGKKPLFSAIYWFLALPLPSPNRAIKSLLILQKGGLFKWKKTKM
jgi:hypothetical protein